MTHPTDALRLVPNMPTVELNDDMLFKIETGETVTYGELKHRLSSAPASPLPGGGDEALIAELKEAKRLMKPFAVYYEINDLDERAADDAIEVPVGDLRLVRAFLARNGKGEG